MKNFTIPMGVTNNTNISHIESPKFKKIDLDMLKDVPNEMLYDLFMDAIGTDDLTIFEDVKKVKKILRKFL